MKLNIQLMVSTTLYSGMSLRRCVDSLLALNYYEESLLLFVLTYYALFHKFEEALLY